MKKTKLLITLLFVTLLTMSTLNAQVSEKVTLHAFGSWAYGNTDGAHYLVGDENGDYNHSQFYLNINAQPFERLSVIAQIGGEQSHDGIEFKFDYAFAEWAFSDMLRLRLGKVKHAFGIYGEILNVGTIRPFLSLPQSIYGSHGFVGKGLNGIGLTGSYYSQSGWGISYDLYWGQLKTISEMPNILTFAFQQDPAYLNNGMQMIERDLADLYGGRLSISTPLDGLSFGFSGYAGEDKSEEETGEGGFVGDNSSYGVHLEYLSSRLWLRSEYIKHIQNATSGQGDNLETITNSFYVEVAVKLLGNWQAAVRYDWNEGDITELDLNMLPRFFQEYMKHQDLAFGLNYWFNSNLVVKCSYHMVEGIKFGFPHFADPMAFLMGDFNNKTKLIQFGIHFSF